jgi:hypothetical protein
VGSLHIVFQFQRDVWSKGCAGNLHLLVGGRTRPVIPGHAQYGRAQAVMGECAQQGMQMFGPVWPVIGVAAGAGGVSQQAGIPRDQGDAGMGAPAIECKKGLGRGH